MDKTKLAITCVKAAQNQVEELRRFVMKDALSGLLNRAATEHCIGKRIQSMTQEDSCALFIVDLDDFKHVNDTLGHQAGDQAVRQSAQILSGLFRANDIVGRLGGDEFVAFVCGAVSEEQVRRKAAEICDSLQLSLGDRTIVNLTASVGVCFSDVGRNFETLYHDADLALYKAKRDGKHRFCFYAGDAAHSERGGVRPVNFIQLSELLENMGGGVGLLEMAETPQLIFVSSSFCRNIGVDAKTYPLPHPLAKLVHPEDFSSLINTLQEGLESGQTVESSHRICADGDTDWFWWHIRAMRIEYDAPNPVMMITGVDISPFKEIEFRQNEYIRLLQTALDQTSKQVWEVDIPTRTFRTYTRDGKYRPLGDETSGFPENLIQGGWIHPNSVSRFRAFARELLDGRAQGFGNFAIRLRAQDHYGWVSVSYRTLYNGSCQAVRAVGVLEELPQNFGGPGAWLLELQSLPESLVADLIMRMHASLTENRMEALWEEGIDLSGRAQETRCSHILKEEWRKVFRKDDRKKLMPLFDLAELLKRFREGRRWLCMEYRRADGSGSIRWVRCVMHMTEDALSSQVHLFFYLLSLEPGWCLEPALGEKERRDPVSGLYDRETIRRAADSLLEENRDEKHAVAVFGIEGLTLQAGKLTSEQVYHELATVLAVAMGGGCVLGQYDASRIVLVFPSVTDREALRRRLEEGIAFVRRAMAPDAPCHAMRFVIGISTVISGPANYDLLLAQALQTCALNKDAAADAVMFAHETDEWGLLQMQSVAEMDQVSVHCPKLGYSLSMGEKDVAFDCMSAMLTAKTLDASLTGVLRTIGAYYHADRVYSLMLTENRQSVVMTFEWTSPSKRSIRQTVSGMRLEHFPLLKRCQSE